jgi:hypothetical protein
MSSLRKVADIILSLDTFGLSIGFQIKGNAQFYTFPGSFASIFCSVIVVSYGYYLATNMFTYGNSSLTQNNKHNFFSQKDVY